MATQIIKPIFISLINHNVSPHNVTYYAVLQWFCQAIKTRDIDDVVISTNQMTCDQLKNAILKAVGSSRPAIGFYICMHGRQFENGGNYVEYLELNQNNLYPDTEFTALINALPTSNLYMFNEVCHSGGFLNSIQLDGTQKSQSGSRSIIIFNASAKEDKAYLIVKSNTTSGVTSSFLWQYKINPFIQPEYAVDVVNNHQKYTKRQLALAHANCIILKTMK